MDPSVDLSDACRSALGKLRDDFMRNKVQAFSSDSFPALIHDLLQQTGSHTVRAKLRDNQASFDGTLQLSQLIQHLLAHRSLLNGFLFMAVQLSVRKTVETGGRSEDSFHAVIDKLRRCSEAGSLFYSRCSDARMPADLVRERVSQAYRLHLAFLGAIVDGFDQGPIDDERWRNIEHHETECTDYLQESESFLLNLLKDASFQGTLPQDAEGASSGTALRSTSVYIVPKKPARFFGRNTELEKIGDSLARHDSLTIRGIAGVGKTSIALRFAHQSMSRYSVIMWMKCAPATALDQSCADALRRLDVIGGAERPGIQNREKWRDFLSQTAFRWLVIFDNVERVEDLEAVWPSRVTGKIIVTTRNPGIGFSRTDDELVVSSFTSVQGGDCILSLTSWPGGVPADPEAAKELSIELGGLPIGIVHMVALMRARKTPIKKFLDDYRRNKLNYHRKQARDTPGIYSDAGPNVGTNWTMSFDALEDRSKSLLGVLSLLSPNDIPQDLFNEWDDPASRSTVGLLKYCASVDEFLDVEADLMSLALVDKDPEDEMLSVHRLEQFQFEQYLDVDARQLAFDRASKLLYDVFPKEHVGQRFTGRWDDCQRYCQHVVTLNEHYLKHDAAFKGYTAPPEFAKLVGWCSWYLFEIADFENFKRLHTGGMKAFEELPADTVDRATWALLNYNAGTVETAMGLFEKARVSLYEALRVRRSLGDADSITATLNNLGLLHGSVHEFDLAEKCYREALEIHLARPETPDRNLSLAMVKHNLQRTAIQRGVKMPSVDDLQGTVKVFEASISWWMTGHAYLVFGNLLLKLKRYGDAAKAYTKAKETLSAPGRAGKQPAVAMVIYKLGCVEYERSSEKGNESGYFKAAEHFRESIAISKLYRTIPAEQARTQAMLAKALRMGGTPMEQEEAEAAERMATSLMKAYHESNGRSEFTTCSEASDFDIFITSKYQ